VWHQLADLKIIAKIALLSNNNIKLPMPELPEVQTIVSDLHQTIIGQKIVNFETAWEKALKNTSLSEFKKTILSQKITDIQRRGKNILIFLENDWVILVHLKMTGQLIFQNKPSKNKILRHNFFLESGFLEFRDVRKFGSLNLVKKADLEKYFEKLGIDALNPKFTTQKLTKILQKNKTKNLKSVLLEQNLITGIGNIYASEILFEAKINPHRQTGSLSAIEINQLHRAIKKILRKAVRMRGTSDSDYLDGYGHKGHFQEVLQVYRKNGQKCPICGTIIEKSTIGQRSTFYCPHCQK